MRWAVLLIAVALSGCLGSDPEPPQTPDEPEPELPARVVVATYDTGTNPFHPCWRHNTTSAWDAIPEIADVALPLELTFEADYEASLAASQEAISQIQDNQLYVIEGTNLLFYGLQGAYEELVDTYTHGAQASSQIGCPEYGLAPDAFVVIVNWYDTAEDRAAGMRWGAEQSWIDVVHLNIQRTTATPPLPSELRDIIGDMADAGQYVVLANGNGWANAAGHIPSETIDFNSIPGTHLAGASDGEGYTSFSNPDPHTVMDGCGTVSAHGNTFGDTSFGGTSSASPRTSGYVAELLRQTRDHFGIQGGRVDGDLIRLPNGTEPASGPLADGALDRWELHEVVRKTADPGLPASHWDGETCVYSLPRYLPLDGADYHRVGYGKLTDETLVHAHSVLIGDAPLPDRPTADRFYELSGTVRDTYWGN